MKNRRDLTFPEETLHNFKRQNTDDNIEEGSRQVTLWSADLLIRGSMLSYGKSLDSDLNNLKQ